MKLGERVYVRDTGRHAKLVAWIDGMPLVQYDDGSTYLAHRVEPIMREVLADDTDEAEIYSTEMAEV